MTAPKVPAAVVWMERPDGRVLALTRGQDFADWHLPGGKWEPQDGPHADGTHDLANTAIREVQEETGVVLERSCLRALRDYTTRSARPVRLFIVDRLPAWVPDRFPQYPAGQPAWVPPEILTLAWASFAYEAAGVIRAVEDDRRHHRATA